MSTSSRSARIAALCFALVAILVLGGLTWATVASLRLKNAEAQAEAQADYNRRLRLALWRIDPLVMNVFAKEASRPYWHYNAYYYSPKALLTNGDEVTGSVIQPSPLLNRQDTADWIQLHFQVSARMGWSSPQLPNPDDWWVWSGGIDAADEPQRRELLTCLEADNGYADFGRLVGDAEGSAEASARWLVGGGQADTIRDFSQRQQMVAPQRAQQRGEQPQQAAQLDQQEYQRRAGSNALVQIANFAPRACDPVDVAVHNIRNSIGAELAQLRDTDCVNVHVSGMTALWIQVPDRDQPLLAMVRTAELANEKVYQGFVVDWNTLSALLVKTVSDLFETVSLAIVESNEGLEPETTLASIPARLVTPPPTAASVGLWEGMDPSIWFAWTAALIALTAVGVGVRSLLLMSERRSQFAYAVTHELRTPLTTLCLYTDMLCDGLVPEGNRDHYINALREESQRLSDLVSGILEYSRVENQTLRLDRQDITVSSLVDILRRRYTERCEKAGLNLVIDLNGLEGATVSTDPQLALQIVGNLIDNACKYAAGEPDAMVTVRAERDNGHIGFEIADNGPGISRADRRRVFKPFRRGRSDRARKTGGVGLGLALARSWARLLGGRLELLSNRPGGGARFRISLPASRPAAAPVS